MVICKFFLQGTCKFGEYCKFEHQINENYGSYQNHNSTSILRQPQFATTQPPQFATTQPTQFATTQSSQLASNPTNVDINTLVKSVVNDMTSAEKGGQWLLSCYAPYKEKPAFPGFEDQSVEEIRLGYYEAVKNGTVEQYKQQIEVMLQQAMMKLKSLQSPSPDIVNMLKGIYNTPASSHAGVYGTNTTTTSNVFGNAANTSISFTQSQPANLSQPSSSIFAQSNQNLFGQPTQNKSIFGSPSQGSNIFSGQATSTPFGNNQSANKSIFGQANSNFVAQSGSAFGTPPQVVQPSSTGIFRGMQTTAGSIFGAQTNSGTGFAAQQSNQAFPSQNLQMQTGKNTVFGGQPGSFGSQNTSALFSQSAPSMNIFGAPTNAQMNQPFSAAPATLQNAPQQTANFVPNQAPVGTMQTSIIPQQSTIQSSPFSQQTTAQGHSSSVFGGSLAGVALQPFQSQTQQIDESLYSKLEDLTKEEIKWFESDDLDILKIPEKPPMYQMCFKA